MTAGGVAMMVDLANAQTWSAEVGRAGMDVRVRSGEVWITRQADHEDHVLRAGEELRSERPGKLVVYALTPAEVEVTPLPETIGSTFRHLRHATAHLRS